MTLRSMLLAALVPSLFSAPVGALAADPFRDLARGLSSGDEAVVESSLLAIAREGGERSMKKLLSLAAKLPASRDKLYWSVLRGAASFVDAPALEALGDYAVSKRKHPIARDIVYALARNGTRYASVALGRVLTKGTDDLRLLAAESLAEIPAEQAVDPLIEALEREEEEAKSTEAFQESPLTDALVLSLSRITGQRFGASPVNWRSWWERNRGKPLGQGGEESHGRTGTAVDTLRGKRQEEFLGLEKAPRKGVIVLSAKLDKVKGPTTRDLNNDHMENVLRRMRVPHEVVLRENFVGFDLSETGAILINCAQFHEFCICPDCKPGGGKNNRLRQCTGCDKHIKFSAKLTAEQIEKLRDFVADGGYVFAEDWIVKELIESAWPKYVSAGPKLTEGRVEVVPARGQSTHPYLRGIFAPTEAEKPLFDLDLDEDDDEGGRTVVRDPRIDVEPKDAELVDVSFRWKIDDESFALAIEDERRVVPLLSSGDLAADPSAHGDAAVALAFRPGSSLPPGQRAGRSRAEPGVVVCVLSHFGKQGSRSEEHTLENLLLNVLIDANVERESRESRPGARRRR